MPIEKIDPDLCNGCRICVDSCFMDIIRFDEKSERACAKYPEDCVACKSCEKDCLVNAIYVSPQRGRLVTPSW